MMKRIICLILMMGMLGVAFASSVYAEENVAGSDELKTVRVGYLIYEGYQEGQVTLPNRDTDMSICSSLLIMPVGNMNM